MQLVGLSVAVGGHLNSPFGAKSLCCFAFALAQVSQNSVSGERCATKRPRWTLCPLAAQAKYIKHGQTQQIHGLTTQIHGPSFGLSETVAELARVMCWLIRGRSWTCPRQESACPRQVSACPGHVLRVFKAGIGLSEALSGLVQRSWWTLGSPL